MEQPRQRWLFGALLVVLTFAAYWPALDGEFVWDDEAHVSIDPRLRGLAGLGRIWFELDATQQYYPLVFTTFWIEQRLWGLNPVGYHVVNLLLHGINALLLWAALRRLALPGAWLAAAVFALHPIHVESVAWISERKNVLSGLLYLTAALAYLRFRPPDDRAPRRLGFYGVAFALFIAGLFAKTVVVTLPAALLLIAWWKRGRIKRADWVPLLPFFAAAVAMGLLTIHMESRYIGAAGLPWELTPIQRLLIAGRALCFYGTKLLLPVGQSFIYPRWEIDPGNPWLYLYPLGVIALMAWLYMQRRRIGRGPLTGVLFFAGTLFPALGFFDVYPFLFSFVADHFQYLASIGLIALLATIIHHGLARLDSRWAVLATILLLATLGSLTWRQASIYQDRRTLWTATLARNPEAWIAHNNLGILLAAEGDLESGLERFNRALELRPAYADAYLNRGNVYAARREPRRAIEEYTRAIEVDPRNVLAHINRGTALQAIGAVEPALQDFARAIELEPTFSGAYASRVTLLLRLGRAEQADDDLTRAIELAPGLPRMHESRCEVRRRLRRYEDALADCDRAIALDSGLVTAHLSRAMIYTSLERYDRAWSDVSRARELGGRPPAGFLQRLSELSGRGE